VRRIEERVSRLAGSEVRSLRRIQSGGWGVSFHAVAELADGRTVFVKAGTEEITSGFVRDEQRFYRSVRGPFMPALVGMDDVDPPLLVLEDLSRARWPPPSDEDSVAAVRATLGQIWTTPPPDWLPPVTDEVEWLLGWAEIERDADPFLQVGLCSRQWIRQALPVLREAAETAPIAGTALLHLDVRSDNICLAEGGAVLVDWNLAHVGNRTSTSRRGCRRWRPKEARSPKSSSRTRKDSRPSSRVSLLRAWACRRRRRRRAYERCSSRSSEAPCPGLPGRSASRR
jgi:hypothetical protein